MNKLQTIELSILRDFDAFCKEHSLQYFLSEGTLLGALRHQGFIPWDDDIDVMMPREDYEKFLKIAPSKIDTDVYQLQHASTVENYWSPFAKLRLLKHDGAFMQDKIAHLTDANGPLLDIFPLDSVPRANSFAQRLNGLWIRLLRRLLALKLKTHKPTTHKQRILSLLTPFFSVRGILGRLDHSFKRFNKPSNQYVVNWGSYYLASKETFAREYVFSETPRLESFEGELFPVPFHAEKVLSKIYGDYMTLPSQEERDRKLHF